MTEKSYPWGGVAPASGADAGRFRHDEWWAAWTAAQAGGGILRAIAAPLRTDPVFANIGVYYCVPNRLLVTDPAVNNRVDIDTGAALVEGSHFYNDASVSITDLPAAATSYIVVRKNYTNALYNPGGGSEVPPYTARLTWVPAIVQDPTRATYWDMPLATVTTVAGVVTIDSDDREYVDASNQCRFAQFVGAWDVLGASEIGFNGHLGRGLQMPNGIWSGLVAKMIIPENYLGGAQLTPVFVLGVAGGAANVQLQFTANWGECNESYAANTLTLGPFVIAVGAGTTKMCPANLVIDLSGTAEPCDTISAKLARRGDLDTFTDPIFGFGMILEYLGWGRTGI